MPELAPALSLRDLVLAALAEAVLVRRTEPGYCGDCAPCGPCEDHREELALADDFERVYKRIRFTGSDGAALAVIHSLAYPVVTP